MSRTLVIAVIASSLAAHQLRAAEPDLKQLLESRLHQIGSTHSLSAQSGLVFQSGPNLLFSVPKDVALVLESHSGDELIPVLTDLKPAEGSLETLIVSNWLMVVRQHLHGKAFDTLGDPPTPFYGYGGAAEAHGGNSLLSEPFPSRRFDLGSTVSPDVGFIPAIVLQRAEGLTKAMHLTAGSSAPHVL